MGVVLANLMALIASLLMVYSGTLLSKKKILLVEIMEIGLFAVSDLILGGISGTIVNAISIVVNLLCYKDKLNLPARIIITIVTIMSFFLLNKFNILGLLLIIGMLTYLWCMNVKNVKHFKLLLIFYMTIWMFYDFKIKLYSSVMFDMLTIIMNILSILKILRDESKANNKKIKVKIA